MVKFAPRIYLKNLILFFVVFGIFWFVGLIFSFGFMNNVGNVTKGAALLDKLSPLGPAQNLGLIIVLFSSVALFLVFFKGLAMGCYYMINEEGILISINWFKMLIHFDEVFEVKEIDGEEVEQTALTLRRAQRNVGNISGVMTSIKDYNDLIKYCTVPIVFNEGRRRMILSSNTAGRFILLEMKNGKKHWITPKDVDGFSAAISNYMKSGFSLARE